MLDIQSIHNRIIRRMQCDSNAAWTAIAKAYLTLNTDSTEREQAWYLYNIGCKRVLDAWLSDDIVDCGVRLMTKRLAALKHEDAYVTEDELFEAPQPIPEDIDYITEIIRQVPDIYRIPVTVVVTELLKNDERKRKPLTVEMTRQYLKKHRVADTSEMARQVYTYLTALNK